LTRADMHKFLRVKVFVCALLAAGCATASELKSFTTDGCSLFPDGTPMDRALWCDCCFNHDIAYWRGGSKVEREEADKTLRACVLDRTGSKALAEMMYDGVRAGGSPVFPTWYRWGYGWKYGRGYRTLTGEEQQQTIDTLDRYRKTHPSGYCLKQ